jgi:murein DD-endopeptidase MepM/ murein hydrolase activator NlpD
MIKAGWNIGILAMLAMACSRKAGVSSPCQPGTKPLYVLPFPVGSSRFLLQGPCGAHSHQNEERFAYDFRMPIGSVITAARAGVVNKVVEDFFDGNNQATELNYILILHEDSTVSRYLHLTRDGAVVQRGDRVKACDTIGYSGNTGVSTEPHLHFDVTGYCAKAPCQTIPVSFKNAEKSSLVQGRWYEAKPYKN